MPVVATRRGGPAIALLAVAMGCGRGAGHRDLDDARAACDAPGAPPSTDVVLVGRLDGSATATVTLALHLDPAAPSGTVSYDGSTTFTLRQPRLERLTAAVEAYRLRYRIDRCEHVAPAGRSTAPWSGCYYLPGHAAPVSEIVAEVHLARRRIGCADVIDADGVRDQRAPASTFSLTGR
jgi:hypothetical protein